MRDSKRSAVIHDLRLEIGGRVAQIDHLLLHRTLTVFVLETKHLHAGIKITEEGEFLSWNDYKKSYEGMASPFAQNERHIAVLRDAFDRVEMPTRMGVRLTPVFSYLMCLFHQMLASIGRSAWTRVESSRPTCCVRRLRSGSTTEAF